MPAKIIFITGTDTGVGKTLLTGLLLAHLREAGVHTLALKPFCSGSRHDVQLLRTLQGRELAMDEINPFYCSEPLAPFAASRLHRRRISLGRALDSLVAVRDRCDCLLVEGIGGLLVPLGPYDTTARAYTVLDLIANLDCQTIVVSRNQLGTINHTLLTVAALLHAKGSRRGLNSVQRARSRAAGKRENGLHSSIPKVVLMDCRRPDFSCLTNPRVLAELLAPVRLFSLPFLGNNCNRSRIIQVKARELDHTLKQLLARQPRQ